MKVNKTMMKVVGATLAVCSAMTMLEGSKTGSGSAKKTIKKTADKITGIVDTLSTFM